MTNTEIASETQQSPDISCGVIMVYVCVFRCEFVATATTFAVLVLSHLAEVVFRHPIIALNVCIVNALAASCFVALLRSLALCTGELVRRQKGFAHGARVCYGCFLRHRHQRTLRQDRHAITNCNDSRFSQLLCAQRMLYSERLLFAKIRTTSFINPVYTPGTRKRNVK